jgi:hypothetical protein
MTDDESVSPTQHDGELVFYRVVGQSLSYGWLDEEFYRSQVSDCFRILFSQLVRVRPKCYTRYQWFFIATTPWGVSILLSCWAKFIHTATAGLMRCIIASKHLVNAVSGFFSQLVRVRPKCYTSSSLSPYATFPEETQRFSTIDSQVPFVSGREYWLRSLATGWKHPGDLDPENFGIDRGSGSHPFRVTVMRGGARLEGLLRLLATTGLLLFSVSAPHVESAHPLQV